MSILLTFTLHHLLRSFSQCLGSKKIAIIGRFLFDAYDDFSHKLSFSFAATIISMSSLLGHFHVLPDISVTASLLIGFLYFTLYGAARLSVM